MRQTAENVKAGGLFCVQANEFQYSSRVSKRFCGAFSSDLSKHLKSFLEKGAAVPSGAKCWWCGEKTFTKCMICMVPLHNLPARGERKGYSCSVDWHNAGNFGLGFDDCRRLKSKKNVNWALPSERAKKANLIEIEAIKNNAQTESGPL